MSDLTSLLMYSLYAPTWSARKLDKKVTADAKKANGVQDATNAGNFNKFVLPDCAELEALSSYIGKVRQWFYTRTAPWGEARGVRVGMAENHLDMIHEFGDLKDGLKPLLDAFESVYASKVQQMEFELHDMFNANDYPPFGIVRQKFALEISIQPLPNVNDIRVLQEIPPHIRQEIEDSLKVEFDKVHDKAIENALEELLKPVANMAKQLRRVQEFVDKPEDGKKRPPLHDSLVENVREIAVIARRLNIARAPDIDKLAEEAEAIVAGVTAKDLKDSDGARVATQKKAEALAARISKYLPTGM